MTWQVGEITAEGNWSVGYEGAYVGATVYPYTCPYGDVDANSLFYGQKISEGEKFRFILIENGTIDTAAGEAQVPPWSSDIRDVFTPTAGFTGPAIIRAERESEVT